MLLSMHFILFDELIMSFTQLRTGPYIGYYGIISPIVNALNLLLSTVELSKTHMYDLLMFHCLPLLYLFSCFCICIVGLPLFCLDVYLSFVLFLVLCSLCICFLIFCCLSVSSKYSILGSLRICSVLISFHLIVSTIFIVLFSMYNAVYFNFYLNCSWNMCCV